MLLSEAREESVLTERVRRPGRVWNEQTGEVRVLGRSGRAIYDLAFSLDGRRLASAGTMVEFGCLTSPLPRNSACSTTQLPWKPLPSARTDASLLQRVMTARYPCGTSMSPPRNAHSSDMPRP